LTTAKDAVKLKAEWTDGFPLEVFEVAPDFMGAEDRLLELILGAGA
jgi:tetraacyldisaccharide-1-P 4'-kinase